MHQFWTQQSAASELCGPKTKNGGSRINNEQHAVFDHNPVVQKSESRTSARKRNSKACRFYWYKPFGCASPKALLYEFSFVKIQKLNKVKSRDQSGLAFLQGPVNRYCRRLGVQRISANLGPPGKRLVGAPCFSPPSNILQNNQQFSAFSFSKSNRD